MVNTVKKKKHTLLGGVKVSSQQLSQWGQLGGRPKKFQSANERLKAWREQQALKAGKKRKSWRSIEEVKDTRIREIKLSTGQTITITPSSSCQLKCNNCGVQSVGSSRHIGEQCSRCYKGECEEIRDHYQVIRRAMNKEERNRSYVERRREKREKIIPTK